MSDATIVATNPPTESETPRSLFRTLLWFGFAAGCLFLFTLVKLPEDRVQEFVGAQINQFLAPQGIGLTARGGKIGLGLSYTMSDARLTLPGIPGVIAFDEIKISPSLLALIQAKVGANVQLKQGSGTLALSGSGRGTSFDFSADARDFDLGKAGILDYLAKIKGSALVTGNAEFSGDTAAWQNFSGKVAFAIKKLTVDEQTLSLQGFPLNIPRLTVSEGSIAATAGNGKIAVQTLKLGGKPGAADDLSGSLTGDITLNRLFDQSNLNLRTSFKFGEKVQKSFSLLETLMAPAKQSDGGFAYDLKGPLATLVPTPALK